MRGQILVTVFYGLSGFVSLGYQVAWFRIFVDRFGSTNLTFALVVGNFIMGLGLGALLSGRICDAASRRTGIRHPLQLYGAIELLVTATALLTLFLAYVPSTLWGTFPYTLRDGVYEWTSIYEISRLVISTLCISVPCLFMGVTFPLLCRAFSGAERFPASLYAGNTLGACLAVLACAFLFIPVIGHDRTFLGMCILNAALGIGFLKWGNRLVLTEPPSFRPAEGESSEPSAAFPTSLLLTYAIIGGFVSGAVEGDMFKRLQFLGCIFGPSMAFISFWAILGIFLASATVRALPRMGLASIKVGYVLAIVVYGIVWHYAYPLRTWANTIGVDSLPPGSYAFQFGSGALLLFTGVVVLPTYYLFSLLLPHLCNRFQGARRHLGIAYGANTVAFCLGMIVFTWIAPAVNIFYSTKFLFVAVTVIVAFLVTLPHERPVARWRYAVLLPALLAGGLFTPTEFDPDYFRPNHPASTYPVRALMSNAAHTTYVVEKPTGDALYFDSYSMSDSSNAAQIYMRLMAHLPLLAQENPERALLICFGVGNTAAAVASYDTVSQIDVVDLNERVFDTAPEFAETNQEVYADARLKKIHDDGRNFLRVTDRRYDLITSEPPPPMAEGVYRLYSREYYTDVLEHLTPDGMMTQWLPVAQLPHEVVRRAIATFVEVFPNGSLYWGSSNMFVLVGGRKPIDPAVIERRMKDPRMARALRDLSGIGAGAPLDIIGRLVKGDGSLRREYSGFPTLSDQHNDLARLYRDTGDLPRFDYDPDVVMQEMNAEKLEMREMLDGFIHSAKWLTSIRKASGDTIVPKRTRQEKP